MKTKKIYLAVAAAASMMLSFNAHATSPTPKSATKEVVTATTISPGGVAPSGLTDEQFKAGLSIDSYVKECKKKGGSDDIIVKSLVSFHAGKHMLVVSGKIESEEYPIVGEYTKAPGKKQINSLLGRKFCSYY